MEPAAQVDPSVALLIELFQGFRFVSYFRGDEHGPCRIVCIAHDDRRVELSREGPETMVRAALGREVVKVCRGPCGQAKPLQEFSRCKEAPSGRQYRCKRCEAARVAAWKARRDRQRAEAVNG